MIAESLHSRFDDDDGNRVCARGNSRGEGTRRAAACVLQRNEKKKGKTNRVSGETDTEIQGRRVNMTRIEV